MEMGPLDRQGTVMRSRLGGAVTAEYARRRGASKELRLRARRRETRAEGVGTAFERGMRGMDSERDAHLHSTGSRSGCRHRLIVVGVALMRDKSVVECSASCEALQRVGGLTRAEPGRNQGQDTLAPAVVGCSRAATASVGVLVRLATCRAHGQEPISGRVASDSAEGCR